MSERDLWARTQDLARQFVESLPRRKVTAAADVHALRMALGGPLPDGPQDPVQVVEELARAAEPGLVATAGPRYFGFVIGGRLPAALAADWLTSTWDQNAGIFATSPAASVVEEVAAGWLRDLLCLPEGSGVGFVTGGQMANFTGLAAARHAVLARAGWNVEEDGLTGAPRVNVVAGADVHVTILVALRYLGLGSKTPHLVPVDDQGRMRADELRKVMARLEGPTIVCAQAGNVNSGAFDPLADVVEIAHERGAWVHVDGAFGLWAAASPRLRHLVRGAEGADSWATDAHKWLNVPYDSGIAVVRDPAAQRAAMTASAVYLAPSTTGERDPLDWAPEFSRRARGFAVYAALRSLGRQGVADLVERSCGLARRMADALSRSPAVRVLNDVVLNQVLVRVEPGAGQDGDLLTKAVIARVQSEGTCWLGGTRWQGRGAIRVSVSNWSTAEEDIDRSAEAILAAVRAELEGRVS